MKKILYLLILNFFISTYAISNLNINATYEISDSTKQKPAESLKVLFGKGLKAYENHNYNNAISIWKKVLKGKDKELAFKTRINIGAAYNAIGYHKTASKYFISVNSSQTSDKKKRNVLG